MRPALPARCSRCWTTGSFLSPQLQDLYDQLNSGRARHRLPLRSCPVHGRCPAPTSGLTGLHTSNHVELVRKARNPEVPESFYTDPLMYQGGSDDFIGPCDDVVVPSEADGHRFRGPKLPSSPAT